MKVKAEPKDKIEELTCLICHKTFSKKGNLTAHMKLHMGKFDFYCDPCKKGFNNVSNYKSHVQIYEGIGYHCQYCSKPFTRKHAVSL